MARVLFGLIPAWGHMNPTIAIAQRLRDGGHTVAYACNPVMAPALERAGLELLDSFRWGDRMVEVQKDVGVRKNRWMAILRGAGGSPTNLYFYGLDRAVEEFVTLLRSWQPDVLVCDLMFHLGAIAAEACHLPYATSCPLVFPLRSSALPPYGVGFSPRAQPSWRWHMAGAIQHWLVHSGDRMVNRVRQRYSLPAVLGAFFYPSPYLFLAYTTEAFEYARPDWQPQVYLVGPSISQHRGDTDVPFPWGWLDGRPVVYFTLGTINTGQVHLFDKAIEASRGQAWQMVISVGRHLDPSRWAVLPQNVLVRDYVPQPTLLRQVRAVISHGGMNTVTEALAAGVPLAVAPTGADQFEAAQRVIEAGAGLRLDLRKVTVEELRGIIRRLLEEPTFSENAQRVAKDYAKCDGPGTSAALILRLAEKRTALLRPAGRRVTIYANEVTEVKSL